MKVIFNDDTRALFEPLFEEAMDILNVGLDINSPDYVIINDLPSYYKVLDELKKRGKAKFLRLPVGISEVKPGETLKGEPYFAIDADTRVIKVPDVFKNNGLGVQYDHTAETLYFTIDRYFDDFDLTVCNPANNKADGNYYGRCLIQWQDEQGNIGLDKAYMFDEGSDKMDAPNYNIITFGWPLHSNVTKVGGKIKFSVIFEVVKDEHDRNSDVLYSFNTKEAECFFHKNFTGSNYGQADIEDVSSLMSTSLRPSFSGIFNSDLGERAYFLPNGDLSLLLNLDENGERELTVSARGSGELLYQWYKDGYIIKGADQNTYTANIAGKYHVKVGNKVGDRTRWISSEVCEIPRPSELRYRINLGDRGYANNSVIEVSVEGLNEENQPVQEIIGTVNYKWYKQDLYGNISELANENENTLTLQPEYGPGQYYVIAQNSNNNALSVAQKSDEMTVRPLPSVPNAVTVSYNTANNTLTAEVDMEYPIELDYSWLYYDAENNHSVTVYTTHNNNTYKPVTNGMYSCSVRQHFWDGDPQFEKESAPKNSDYTPVDNL